MGPVVEKYHSAVRDDLSDLDLGELESSEETLHRLQGHTVRLATRWAEVQDHLRGVADKEALTLDLLAQATQELEMLQARIPRQYWETETGQPTGPVKSAAVVNQRARSVQKPKGVVGMTTEDSPYGIMVSMVIEKGAAEKGGIMVGDVIYSWAGRLIQTRKDLNRALSIGAAGIPVDVEVFREGYNGLLTFELIPTKR